MIQKTFLLILLILPFQLLAQSIDELILNRKYEKALERIQDKIQENPDAELYFKQAAIYKEQLNPLLASKALEKALQYDAENILYLSDLGDNYATLGNLYQSVDCYRRAVLLSPQNISLKGKLGRAYISIDDFKRAFVTFESIRSVDSTNVYFNKQYAFCAYKNDQADLAIRIYEQVLNENPGDFSTHLNLITIFKKKKDAEKVYQTGVRALNIFPKNGTFLIRLADALFDLKEYEKARPMYEEYLSLGNEATFDILKNCGISLYFCKSEEQAIKALEGCYKMSPDDQFVDFYLGLCYKRLANYPKSAEYLTEAIKMSYPSYLSEIYHHLGQVYGNNRDFEKSIEALKKSYEFDPENFEALFEIATTYEEYNFNKTLALNYYSTYLKSAGDRAKNVDYALDRIRKIKEELFFENK